MSRELQQGLSSDADPQTVIPLIVTFIMDGVLRQPELMRLLYVAGFELAGAERVLGEHLGPIYDAINAYFRRCALRGIIEDFDPAVATLGLAGAVGAHYTLQGLFTRDRDPRAPEYSRFLLNALQKSVAPTSDPVAL
jgi:hypothetical protein